MVGLGHNPLLSGGDSLLSNALIVICQFTTFGTDVVVAYLLIFSEFCSFLQAQLYISKTFMLLFFLCMFGVLCWDDF